MAEVWFLALNFVNLIVFRDQIKKNKRLLVLKALPVFGGWCEALQGDNQEEGSRVELF